MGSTGSGNFSDYQGYGGNPGPGSGKGGASGADQCARAFSTSLEEVATCDYFTKTRKVPDKGVEVSITFDKRLVAVDSGGTYIGYLPTKYNYLKACMEGGYSYSGVVQSSSIIPVPAIMIDIAPAK